MAARPDVFGWAHGPGSAALSRTGLVVPPWPETPARLAEVQSDLRARTRALRRSVHLRHVDAGSDGTEEWEILALLNPVYDIHRLGMFFTASPRHADVLLVTGAGARGMIEPLQKSYDAMPHPKVVIAVGTDAVGGGLPRRVLRHGRRDRRHRPGGRVAAGIAAQPVQHPVRAAARLWGGCPPGKVARR